MADITGLDFMRSVTLGNQVRNTSGSPLNRGIEFRNIGQSPTPSKTPSPIDRLGTNTKNLSIPIGRNGNLVPNPSLIGTG